MSEIQKLPQTIHVIYFWNALGTRSPMAMFWGVRHANTQRQDKYDDKYTVAKCHGDPLFSKWGPDGDPIFSEMGTKWGTSPAKMRTQKAHVCKIDQNKAKFIEINPFKRSDFFAECGLWSH